MLADLMGSNDPELSATVVADETAPAVLEQETPSLDEQLATAERQSQAAQDQCRVTYPEG